MWIAVKLLKDEEEKPHDHAESLSFWAAMRTIIIADVIMSLDNVLAIAGAAHGEVWLILFGLGVSIPLLMWGSTLVARWMNRHPLLIALGAAVLAYTAVDMIVHDAWMSRWMGAYREWGHRAAPLLAAAVMFWLARRMRMRPGW